jgi:peptide/nickel transport system substrate-binding protein
MERNLRALAAASAFAGILCAAQPTAAQKQGGVLKVYHRDSPASMSILEEATISSCCR